METVQGAVERVLFQAPDSDYIVFRIRREDDESLLTVTGNGPKPLVGDRIEIMGRWTQHKKYGRQMAASAWKRLVPDTADGIERFFGVGSRQGHRTVSGSPHRIGLWQPDDGCHGKGTEAPAGNRRHRRKKSWPSLLNRFMKKSRSTTWPWIWRLTACRGAMRRGSCRNTAKKPCMC